MGVTKTVIAEGSGASPQKGDTVTMEYTGWLRTSGQPEEKGKQFDSTTGRGPFKTPIGVGRVIKGEFADADGNKDNDGKLLLTTTTRLGRGCRADEARREGQARHHQRLCLRQPGVPRPHPSPLGPHLVRAARVVCLLSTSANTMAARSSSRRLTRRLPLRNGKDVHVVGHGTVGTILLDTILAGEGRCHQRPDVLVDSIVSRPSRAGAAGN